MQKVEKPLSDVGVVIARFQVAELHSAHRDLIASVCALHPKVIVLLGLTPLKVTRNNPLDYESRQRMVTEAFPKVLVSFIQDVQSDAVWSRNLDATLAHLVGPGQTVTLYGSRDSFIRHYSGRYTVQELVPETYVSGTEMRKAISRTVMNTPEFRAGVIWGAYNQYPKCYPTVDIAIFNEDASQLLLARKPGELLYRFVGGFADPGSPSYEADAAREAREETGLEVVDIRYMGSFIVDDWRYAGEVDKIKTLLFRAKRFAGTPKANDDICEVKWFDVGKLQPEQVMPLHRPLLERLMSEIGINK